jgi:hypothetical protein
MGLQDYYSQFIWTLGAIPILGTPNYTNRAIGASSGTVERMLLRLRVDPYMLIFNILALWLAIEAMVVLGFYPASRFVMCASIRKEETRRHKVELLNWVIGGSVLRITLIFLSAFALSAGFHLSEDPAGWHKILAVVVVLFSFGIVGLAYLKVCRKSEAELTAPKHRIVWGSFYNSFELRKMQTMLYLLFEKVLCAFTVGILQHNPAWQIGLFFALSLIGLVVISSSHPFKLKLRYYISIGMRTVRVGQCLLTFAILFSSPESSGGLGLGLLLVSVLTSIFFIAHILYTLVRFQQGCIKSWRKKTVGGNADENPVIQVEAVDVTPVKNR